MAERALPPEQLKKLAFALARGWVNAHEYADTLEELTAEEKRVINEALADWLCLREFGHK